MHLTSLSPRKRYTRLHLHRPPHDPAETLAHKYGDCKDKATLLAVTLRAAEIPAYVALLNAASRLDVLPDLPGMGLFDHAIVYVPGSPALWMDATDQYARLGQLPINDQGRKALIARKETTAQVTTPESTSKDNLLLEYREINLSENGPARGRWGSRDWQIGAIACAQSSPRNPKARGSGGSRPDGGSASRPARSASHPPGGILKIRSIDSVVYGEDFAPKYSIERT